MSARHAWLRFVATGAPLTHRLDDPVREWQGAILADHQQWYGPDAPEQVSNAFVLQYLLQVPAHTAAGAAGVGMRVPALTDVTFELGSGAVPHLVEIGEVECGTGDLEARLTRAEMDFREVAEPLARDYRSTHPMSSRQRQGMVTDMWAEAARVVRGSDGIVTLDEPRRISCCLIYALPGCVECAGCPRHAPAGGGTRGAGGAG